MDPILFKDRIEAGLLLSEHLMAYKNSNTLILAVPRGGVPVGYVIAKMLELPLGIVLSKKIPHPLNKEFAIGAVSLDSIIIDENSGVSNAYIDSEIIRLRESLREKYELYMGNRVPLPIEGKNIIIVDDGIATGNTLLASVAMLRKKKPAKIIVAVPVAPENVAKEFKKTTDEFVCLNAAKYFRGVGAFYEHFGQVEDEEVIRLLRVPNTVE